MRFFAPIKRFIWNFRVSHLRSVCLQPQRIIKRQRNFGRSRRICPRLGRLLGPIFLPQTRVWSFGAGPIGHLNGDEGGKLKERRRRGRRRRRRGEHGGAGWPSTGPASSAGPGPFGWQIGHSVLAGPDPGLKSEKLGMLLVKKTMNFRLIVNVQYHKYFEPIFLKTFENFVLLALSLFLTI